MATNVALKIATVACKSNQAAVAVAVGCVESARHTKSLRHRVCLEDSTHPTKKGDLRRPAGDDRRVVPAEAEAVAHHRAELAFPRRVRRVVQIAIRIGRVVVDRRRADVVLERLHADHQLHAAAGAQQMAELALGARDAHFAGRVAEYGFDGERLGLIAQRRARAVGIDVVDRVGVDFGVPQRRTSPSPRRFPRRPAA